MVTRRSNSTNCTTPRVLEQELRASHEVPTWSEERSRQGGPIRLLRLAQVLNVTGLGKTKIYELQSQGTFPMRVQITDHSVGWVEAEVQTWLAKRIALSASLRPEPTGRSSALRCSSSSRIPQAGAGPISTQPRT